MKKAQRLTLIASLLVALLLIGGAVVYSRQQHTVSAPTPRPQRPVSKAELAAADGKNGHICYVAVDGTVYEIQGFALWQNGEHIPSRGQAYCGADMSKVIDKAPHGRKVLNILIKVGPLTS